MKLDDFDRRAESVNCPACKAIAGGPCLAPVVIDGTRREWRRVDGTHRRRLVAHYGREA